MYQHIDLMAAQSMGRERERRTQTAVRGRDADLRAQEWAARRAPARPAEHRWLHDLLVRVHLVHAPIH